MGKIDNLVVYVEDGGSREEAEALAMHLEVPVSAQIGDELTLIVGSDKLTLSGYGLSFYGDFEKMYRRISNGRLAHEMLIHVAKTKEDKPRAIDATAGMGDDSILLAAYGYEVTLFEQNPVVAALLKDAIRRGKLIPELKPVMDRMHVTEGNSVELMPKLEGKYDIVYLDPMFPAKSKNSLVNKKLQLIQKLEQPCVQEEELLEAALEVDAKKIVIKRPLKGAVLAGRKPSYTVKGKAIRYDCLVIKS